MIFDSLSQSHLYDVVHPRLAAGFDFLRKNNVLELAEGKYEIDGTDLFAIVSSYPTKPKEEVKWECHEKYIDIQYIAEGVELIGYAPLASMESVTPYNDVKDVAFLKGEGNYVVVPQGYFAVFYPHDAHGPNLAVDQSVKVKKVVVKIKL